MNHPTMVSLITFFLLCSTGCVKRAIVVESDPPGASVWINERSVGKTPVEYEFITHGRYKFRLEKSGFQPLTARERVKAPPYQWIPIDFFAEHLLPARLDDRHVFRYHLNPISTEERLAAPTPADREKALADLTSPVAEKRRAACVALAEIRNPADVSAVLAATSDADPVVRAEALGSLRAIQGPPSLEKLTEALRSDADPNVRWRAAIELEALKDKKAVPALIQALKDRSALVRGGAAEALKGIPDPQALSPLMHSLRDSDTSVRRAATEGLGKIGDRQAVRPLTKVLFHHDVQTRRRAAESLAKLKDPSSATALVRTFTDWDPKVRRTATETLIAIGNTEVVPLLIRRLRGLKPWTREHAAQALGGLKDPRAIEPLKVALQREPYKTTRIAMEQALKDLGQ